MNASHCGLAFVSALALLGVASPAPAPADVTIAFVPRGTIVAVTVPKDIRIGGFGNNTEVKKVRLAVTQDVVVDGYVIAKAGDLVEGHYTNQTNVTDRIFSIDESQELALDVDDVVNFCGDTIHLQFERTFVGGARRGLFSLGTHAHDALFAKGVVLKTQTDRPEKTICAQLTSATPAPLPSPIVVSDEEAQATAGSPP